MIHFDAHSDTNDRYFGDNRYTHGTPFRRAIEEGLLDPKRIVQIGIRGSIYAADDMDFAESTGMRVIYMEEFCKRGDGEGDRGGARASSATARPISASTSTASIRSTRPAPARRRSAASPRCEAQQMLRACAGSTSSAATSSRCRRRSIRAGKTALAGATMMFEIMCVLADAVARRRGGKERPR